MLPYRLSGIFSIWWYFCVFYSSIETLFPTDELQVHGLKIRSYREQLCALFCATGGGRFVCHGAPPWFARVFCLSRDGCDCLFELPFVVLESQAQVA